MVERDEPRPAAHEVVVKFRAASLNYRDLLFAKGSYNPKARFPAVPLSDGAGEVVAAGEGVSNGQATGILKHSTDGGQTWTTIQPRLNVPGTQSAQVWHVQQLSMVGGRLFGLQMLARHVPPVVFQDTPSRSALTLAQLVMSSDGGHSWNVLDNQFAGTRQQARAYAVDPANSS